MSAALRYIDVCSGISAPTMAWKPLGWQALCFAEIEAAPRAVLSHHYPEVPLHGDFTAIRGDEHGPVDLLVGGTPCQDFSVAGLRAGLGGERGNLTLEFLKLLGRTRARWVVWENVPGTFSSLSHEAPDFRPPPINLGAGDGPEDGEEIVVEDQYDADESHAFACFLAGLSELRYGWAYRVLDAQFAGVPQRRRRVFVVGYLGDWRRAAAVLFERHGLQGHPPPRREAGERVARPIAAGSKRGSGYRNDADTADNLIAPTLNATYGEQTGQDYMNGLIAFDTPQITSAGNYSRPEPGDPCHPLAAGAHPPAVAFDWYASEWQSLPITEECPPLKTTNQPAVAYDMRGRVGGAQFEGPHESANLRAAGGGSSRSYVAASSVRRLTPRECERLQGFPDDFTLVPHRGKPMADGPRYKMLGNSMAVPVVRWIGERIAMVEAIGDAEQAAAA